MTLQEWSEQWPYQLRPVPHCKVCGESASMAGSMAGSAHRYGPVEHGPFEPADIVNCYVTPDNAPVPESVRAQAFRLTDFVVSSVTGGSIWFVRR